MAAGRTKGTWTKGQGGKPKGAKDHVPRSVKTSVRWAYEQLMKRNPDMLEAAILQGMLSPNPREAYPFVRLAAELQGELKQVLEHTVTEMRPLVIDRVTTRAELKAALGEKDTDAGDDDEDA